MSAVPKPLRQKIYRVLDANLNRAREGLRVVEEVFRLVRGDAKISQKIKHLRHQIVKTALRLPVPLSRIKLSRASDQDVGRASFPAAERTKKNVAQLAMANLGRAEEALRVLEEFSKLVDSKISFQFKKLRFDSYTLETEIVKRLIR